MAVARGQGTRNEGLVLGERRGVGVDDVPREPRRHDERDAQRGAVAGRLVAAVVAEPGVVLGAAAEAVPVFGVLLGANSPLTFGKL